MVPVVTSKLLKYIPEDAAPIVYTWFERYKFQLRISKPRKTKLGDFRPSNHQFPHRISVNGDLNKYHFLLTLTHEVAHLISWNKYKNSILPHGSEWKLNYKQLMDEVLQEVSLPQSLLDTLKKHLANPKATSSSDALLIQELRKYDVNNHRLLLHEIEEGAHFLFQEKRRFRKGKLRRTRYLCQDLSNGKAYLIHRAAEVELLN